MDNIDYKKGDTVALKSGGPYMTVDLVVNDVVGAMWYSKEKGEYVKENFTPDMLLRQELQKKGEYTLRMFERWEERESKSEEIEILKKSIINWKSACYYIGVTLFFAGALLGAYLSKC